MVVSYVAQGRDAFVYDAVGGGRKRSGAVRFTLSYQGARPVVAPSSLQPSEVGPGVMTWRFSDLISEKPIRVELPAGSSPLGRLILLCQLAGLAVLLFGAGFWYLSEGQRPGGLDHFRLGHFLLVALTYSLFFVVFAVVGYRGSLAAALLLGAGTSLPLLLLHTSRTSGWPFALHRGLPLSLFSLGCVVLGVYLEDQRAYVLMGATVAGPGPGRDDGAALEHRRGERARGDPAAGDPAQPGASGADGARGALPGVRRRDRGRAVLRGVRHEAAAAAHLRVRAGDAAAGAPLREGVAGAGVALPVLRRAPGAAGEAGGDPGAGPAARLSAAPAPGWR